MAKQQQIVAEPLEAPFPLGGVNHDNAFYAQPKGTTPLAYNVVPYDCVSQRRRGSRRAGFSKFIEAQIADASLQEITTVSVSVSLTESTGDLFSHGATSTTYRVYDNTQADTTPDVNYTSGTLNAHSMGCTDEDNNFYVATVTTRTVTIEKMGTDFTKKWTATLTLAGSGNAAIFGIAAFDGTLYVYPISQTTGAITAPGIYRFSTATGVARESAPWLQPTTLAYVAGVTTTAEITVAHQGIKAGAGILAVVGSTTLAGGNLVLQQFDLITGLLTAQTTLEAFSSYPCKVEQDRGANFYVATNLISGTKKIYKVNGDGALVTAFATITCAGMLDFCFEPVHFQLAVVGNNLAASGFSLRRYDATTGLVAHAGHNPGTFTTWNAIASDGLGDDGFLRLRRSVAAANVDIISTSAVATTDVSTWTLISSLGVITDRLWAVTAGLHAAPLRTSMQSTRTTRFMCVAGGGLYSVRNKESSLVKAAFLVDDAPVVFSAINNNVLNYVDGFNYGTYDTRTGVAGTLTATAGDLPVDENGWRCRLICTWRNRTVLAGLLSDPQNWFMSSATDSLDWDYDPQVSSATQAIAGNNTEGAGKVPDAITALIPHTDNMLIFGCESAIYRMTGDPADFGRMDLISDETGMAFGRAWCKDPAGVIYFFGSRGGLWRMGIADTPQRISTPVDAELNQINLNTYQVQMAWDDLNEGIHLVISPIDEDDEATHYWWDSFTQRKTSYQVIKSPGSWWPTTFGNKDHNALCVHVLDSDDPEDRVVLWGGRDGYIRFFDSEAMDDDGTVIESFVLLGPFHMKFGNKFVVTDIPCVMASDSADVEWGVWPGECIEAAYNAAVSDDARFTGTFSAGRNHSQAVRSSQHAVFFGLSSSVRATRWSQEEMMLMVRPSLLTASRIF